MSSKNISSYIEYIKSKISKSEQLVIAENKNEYDFYPVNTNYFSCLPPVVTLQDRNSDLKIYLYDKRHYLANSGDLTNPYSFINDIKGELEAVI